MKALWVQMIDLDLFPISKGMLPWQQMVQILLVMCSMFSQYAVM